MIKWLKAFAVAFIIILCIAFSWILVPLLILIGLTILIKGGMDADKEMNE